MKKNLGRFLVGQLLVATGVLIYFGVESSHGWMLLTALGDIILSFVLGWCAITLAGGEWSGE